MKATWIAVDWGTSNFRAWAVDAAGAVIDEAQSNQGGGGLEAHQFEGVLLSHIEPWLEEGVTPVIACGMVGSRQGWFEAPYIALPCAPASVTARVPTRDRRLDMRIVPGLKQTAPANVMRGEETQIAGFLTCEPHFEGVLCLPGTHSKWVRISGGQIIGFDTAMTGEIYALIAKQSVLRHSIGVWHDGCFEEAVAKLLARPEGLATMLFEIRARHLIEGDDCGQARLSGILIGAELNAARDYWQSAPVVIIGDNKLSKTYARALAVAGGTARAVNAAALTLEGLRQIYEKEFTHA